MWSPLQCVQFDVRPGVCVSGASAESVARLLGELAQYGTYYLRLSRFSQQSADKRGLVFQVCLYNYHNELICAAKTVCFARPFSTHFLHGKIVDRVAVSSGFISAELMKF